MYIKNDILIFYLLTTLSWTFYILGFLGIYLLNKSYLVYFNTIVKLYVALILLVKFNPFIKIKIRKHDRTIAFSSGAMLLTSSILT